MLRHLPILLAILLLSLAAARAQEAADPNQQPAETAPATPAEPATKAPPNKEDSPFDYEASEQISEDLSVSFPVDI